MTDQHKFWNESHRDDKLYLDADHETPFAVETNNLLKPGSRILELGCGKGNDSCYFAASGHDILATDFSEIVVNLNQERYGDVPGLEFAVLDLNKPFAHPDAGFDCVYARLSLHYFSDAQTRCIFQEIARVLKPGGHLAFMCANVADHRHGQGRRLEAYMYELKNHVRHFFTPVYAAEMCAQAGLAVDSNQDTVEQIYGGPKPIVKTLAHK